MTSTSMIIAWAGSAVRPAPGLSRQHQCRKRSTAQVGTRQPISCAVHAQQVHQRPEPAAAAVYGRQRWRQRAATQDGSAGDSGLAPGVSLDFTSTSNGNEEHRPQTHELLQHAALRQDQQQEPQHAQQVEQHSLQTKQQQEQQRHALIPQQVQQQHAASEEQQQQLQETGSNPAEQQAAPQQQRWQLPAVPWALNTTITLMVVWLLSFWLAAYSLVPALLKLAGVESITSGSASSGGAAAAATAAWAQALRHLVLDTLQVAATLLLLRRGLHGYHPRRLGLFAAPLRPLRQWLPAVAAGVATFPFIDWVHKRMVLLLAVNEHVVSGTAEQILGTSSWQTQALWFGVLAVCAPLWEEIMFRGFLLPSLARYLPKWGAIAATSLIFAMVHFSREGLLPLLLLGCVFGTAYAATRNLLAPIALHSLWNMCLLVQLLWSGGL